jgi:hypothetical protein
MLTDVDLSGLCHVRAIGSGFFAGCGSLTRIDLSPLREARTIGSDCLKDRVITDDSTRLMNVSLTSSSSARGGGAGLRRLDTVGPGFASGCTALKQLDLTGQRGGSFRCVTTVDGFFLDSCGLTKVSLFGLVPKFGVCRRVWNGERDCSWRWVPRNSLRAVNLSGFGRGQMFGALALANNPAFSWAHRLR